MIEIVSVWPTASVFSGFVEALPIHT